MSRIIICAIHARQITVSVILLTSVNTGFPWPGEYLEMKFFQVREKSGNFVDGQRNLERTGKVREKSGSLKINGFGRQSSENLFILFKWGRDVLSHEIV